MSESKPVETTAQSVLCIPYSLRLLGIINSQFSGCSALGLAYVIALTVSMFNLLAMVITEAYIFHEKNMDDKTASGGTPMCLLFGITTVYIGSVILHLGPTLIGGEFTLNPDIGNCTFAYGKIQNYIVQVIWITIVTLTMVAVFHYIVKFYQQLKSNQRFRIMTLARNAAAYTKGKQVDEDIYTTVSKLKRRVRVYICISCLYCICWYPLFSLTIIDYKYQRPRYEYRILTILAYSHSTLVPVTYMILDDTFGITNLLRQAIRGHHKQRNSPSQQALVMSHDIATLPNIESSENCITQLTTNKTPNKRWKHNHTNKQGDFEFDLDCGQLLLDGEASHVTDTGKETMEAYRLYDGKNRRLPESPV